MIPNPQPPATPDRFDSLVKVGITAEDHLGLTWLAQTAGMSRSGFVRSLIRQRLTDPRATPPAGRPSAPPASAEADAS